MITVVGGVYYEQCLHPQWNEVYGSAGRAAQAIARMGESVELHTYLDELCQKILSEWKIIGNFNFYSTPINKNVTFQYMHGLAEPLIMASKAIPEKPLKVKASHIISFGLIEGNAIVDADYVVYDPQNVKNPAAFNSNGSQANHLALVLNRYEAALLSGMTNASPVDMAKIISTKHNAEVVVIKLGPEGAVVFQEGQVGNVPSFMTDKVWPIGSGDTFVAHFGLNWMARKLSPVEAALQASKATAYYCLTQTLPTQENLNKFTKPEIKVSTKFSNGYKPMVYLAGPFFTLAQRWMIEQARDNLTAIGLQVFSPFHDIGLGSAEDVVHLDIDAIRKCDLLFAIGDGLDAGTLYEIGYARALNKPVIVYSENETKEDLKMMEGSNCILSPDYTSAIYKTLWEAVGL